MVKSVSDSVSQNLFNDKLLYRPVATNPVADIPLALSNSSEVTPPSKPSLGISYQIDVDQTCMDAVHAYLHESTPEDAFLNMPDKWVKMNDSIKYCHIDNQKAYDDLPRTDNGEIDIEKIRSSLAKASELIKAQNELALAEMDYGIYKEALNSMDVFTFFFGFEVAQLIREAVEATGVELPKFLTTGVSPFVMMSEVAKFIEKMSSHKSNEIKTMENKVGKLAEEFLLIKSNEEIRADIQEQNSALDQLASFEITSEEEAKLFLEAYLQITGTTFSCERIDKFYESQQNPDSSKKEALIDYAASCGASVNYVNAIKNNIATDVAYNVVLRTVLPTILYNIPTPATKIIGLVLPTYLDTLESATQGCERGALINLDNVTDYENIIDILARGQVQAAFIGMNGAIGKQILSSSKALRGLFKPVMTNNWWKNRFKKLGSGMLKLPRNYSLKWGARMVTKLAMPDLTAKDALWRVLVHPYHVYKTLREDELLGKAIAPVEEKILNFFS